MHGIRGTSRYRTVWISDTHLGTRGCQAEFLLDFLRHTECETLYLVGDIIDGWRLKRSWYWTETQNEVVQEVLKKSRRGCQVIYVPGNHDEVLRDYTELFFGGVLVKEEAIHKGADGRRYLVIHGDKFDSVVRYAKWLALLGDWAYTVLLSTNTYVNMVRRWLKLPYWSLSAYLKHKVKNAVEFISHYEDAVVQEARRRGVDGVVCGHIHHAEMREIDGVLYCNDGDWVESCTALVERADGSLEIVRWTEVAEQVSQIDPKRLPAKASA
ncbi:MAG: UDP-2,3-diacylglucosamine diphosphatase [Alphaproteobacteria bacterium]